MVQHQNSKKNLLLNTQRIALSLEIRPSKKISKRRPHYLKRKQRTSQILQFPSYHHRCKTLPNIHVCSPLSFNNYSNTYLLSITSDFFSNAISIVDEHFTLATFTFSFPSPRRSCRG